MKHVFIAAFALTLALGAVAHAQSLDDPDAFWDDASLYRDEWGVPHVFAGNLRALAYAFGYAQAQDHFVPMLKAYRIANGRAAEVYGEDYAESDEFSIRMGHNRLAREALDTAGTATLALCEGFAMGANTWMVENAQDLPEWVQGVAPEDPLALLHCYLMSHAPFDLQGAFRRHPASITGNAFAVGPQRTQSGAAMLAINPHTSYEGPFQWYEAHLICQDLNVSGATLFGIPVIMQGHNGILGWALTPNFPDFADIYAEETPEVEPDLKGASPMSALIYAAGMLQLAGITEPYYVTTPGGMEERFVARHDTPRGPIITSEASRDYAGAFAWDDMTYIDALTARPGNRFYSYKVGGYYDFGALNQFLQMGRASDLSDFQDALLLHQLPCFHVTYADRDGNLFYLYNTKTGTRRLTERSWRQPVEKQRGRRSKETADKPREPAYIDWTSPLSANNIDHAWGPLIPVDELPYQTNPPDGYLQACGNPPWLSANNSWLRAADWDHLHFDDFDTPQAAKVRELLAAEPLAFKDLQSILYDVDLPHAETLVNILLDIADDHPKFVRDAHPDLAEGLDLLGNWDFAASTQSTAATFFHAWWLAVQENVDDVFGSPAEFWLALDYGFSEIEEFFLRTATEGARFMRNEFGSLSVPWGQVHVLRRGSQHLPMGGCASGESLFIADGYTFENRQWPVQYGYGYAMVVEFGEQARAVSIHPFGTSENPDSPHYADQFPLFAKGKFKKARFNHDDIQRHAELATGRRVLLRPKGLEGLFTLSSWERFSASLKTSLDAPAALPHGLTTFSVYVTPRVHRAGAPVGVAIGLYIEPALCTSGALDSLAIYAYEEQWGWRRVEQQAFDLDTYTFSARGVVGPVYAVLGPQDARAELPEVILEKGKALAPGKLVARFIPGLAIDPADMQVRGSTDEKFQPLEAPPEQMSIAQELALAQGERKHIFKMQFGSQPLEPQTQGEDAPGTPAKTEEPLTPIEPSTEPIQPQQEEPEAAPEVRYSRWLRGDTLELQAPGMDALFVITADRRIKGRLAAFSRSPAELPKGFAVFTDYVAAMHAPPDTPASITMLVNLPPKACPQKNIERLSIYVLTAEEGWKRLPNQSLDVSTRSFTATDVFPRLYAILGPEECLPKETAP